MLNQTILEHAMSNQTMFNQTFDKGFLVEPVHLIAESMSHGYIAYFPDRMVFAFLIILCLQSEVWRIQRGVARTYLPPKAKLPIFVKYRYYWVETFSAVMPIFAAIFLVTYLGLLVYPGTPFVSLTDVIAIYVMYRTKKFTSTDKENIWVKFGEEMRRVIFSVPGRIEYASDLQNSDDAWVVAHGIGWERYWFDFERWWEETDNDAPDATTPEVQENAVDVNQEEGHDVEGREAEGYQVGGDEVQGYEVEGYKVEGYQIGGNDDGGNEVQVNDEETTDAEGKDAEGNELAVQHVDNDEWENLEADDYEMEEYERGGYEADRE